MTRRPLPPSPNRSHPPPFHKMEAGQFEEMCCALIDKEPGILQADLHQAQRQTQFGVDIIAKHADSEDIDVASCKCYVTLKKDQIRKFSDEFLPHWDTHWHDKNVRRFVLCVAADVKSKQRRAEIAREIKRFKAIGLEYIVWGPRKLQELCRPHKGIVSQYVGEEWVSRLCGTVRPETAPSSTGQILLDNAVVAQLGALQTVLSEEMESRLDLARESLHRGKRSSVADELANIKSDNVLWTSLSPEVQARILRMEAILKLGDGEIQTAKDLAGAADTVYPQDEPRLRAIIAFRSDGPQAALDILSAPTTRDGINLRAAILLEVGNHDAAIELLKRVDDSEDAEVWRIRGYARLLAGDQEGALEAQQVAERIAPDWLAVQHAAGVNAPDQRML